MRLGSMVKVTAPKGSQVKEYLMEAICVVQTPAVTDIKHIM
jgi:hypothetical protein